MIGVRRVVRLVGAVFVVGALGVAPAPARKGVRSMDVQMPSRVTADTDVRVAVAIHAKRRIETVSVTVCDQFGGRCHRVAPLVQVGGRHLVTATWHTPEMSDQLAYNTYLVKALGRTNGKVVAHAYGKRVSLDPKLHA